MRQTLLALCAVAVIGASLHLAWSQPVGTSWMANGSSGDPYLYTRASIGTAGTFEAEYMAHDAVRCFTDPDMVLWIGDLVCPEGTDSPFAVSLYFPAGGGSKWCPVKGGSYKFSCRKDDPPAAADFCQSLSQCLVDLDYGYRGNATKRQTWKSKPVLPFGGNVQVLDVSASGKSKPAGGLCDGKFKFSYSGTVLDGPNAGLPFKGKMQIAFSDAVLDE